MLPGQDGLSADMCAKCWWTLPGHLLKSLGQLNSLLPLLPGILEGPHAGYLSKHHLEPGWEAQLQEGQDRPSMEGKLSRWEGGPGIACSP